jgi:hypothetical protein
MIRCLARSTVIISTYAASSHAIVGRNAMIKAVRKLLNHLLILSIYHNIILKLLLLTEKSRKRVLGSSALRGPQLPYV